MSNKTCGRCLHWDKYNKHYGECLAIKMKECGADTGDSVAYIRAYAAGDYGLYSELVTRAGFSCGLFENADDFTRCNKCHCRVPLNEMTWESLESKVGYCKICWEDKNG